MTLALTTDEILKRFQEVHGDTYDYSKINYINSYTKVIIICKKHGEFLQLSHSHIAGNGCPKCMPEKIGNKFRSTRSKFIEKAKEKFGNKFNYDQVIYKNTDTPVLIKCNKHNWYFYVTPYTHLKGQGSCPKCRYEFVSEKQTLTLQQFIKKSQEQHGTKYDYSKVKYLKNSKNVCIICPIHGEFWQIPGVHMTGGGCPICARLKQKEAKYTTNSFIKKASKIHKDKYDYSKTKFIKMTEKIKIICPVHGEFKQIADAHIHGKGCRKCVNQISNGEKEVYDWLKSLNLNIEISKRNLIPPYEIDIYLPKYNIGIEYNGIYWHSELQGKDQKYHKNKTILAQEKNIRLIQIWDNEWYTKQEIVKSIILNALHKTSKKEYARKLKIKEVPSKEARLFCESNHIHEFRSGNLYLGLWKENKLKALMITNQDGEMVRFVTEINNSIIGGFSKLLKYSPIKYSYVDARLFTGESYLNNGFTFVKWTKPNYFYTKNYSHLESRQKYQKHKLKKVLPNFKDNLTEVENMFQNGWDRIWDCGHFLMRKE
jgi:hypothetical protein